MECRIEVVQQSNPRVVRVAGRLSEAQVPDLLTVCAGLGGGVLVDFTDLVGIDAVGIESLRRIQAGGGELANLPHYIQLRLDGP